MKPLLTQEVVDYYNKENMFCKKCNEPKELKDFYCYRDGTIRKPCKKCQKVKEMERVDI